MRGFPIPSRAVTAPERHTAARAFLARRLGLALAAGFAGLFCFACSFQGSREVRAHLEEPFPKKLSAWRLFVGKLSSLQPNQGVVPYDLNTPLFKDYARKHRFVWMPPGESALYSDTEAFQFPVGTILSKTFSYPENGSAASSSTPDKERLIETRLLVHAKSGWIGLPYVWNQEQTEATLEVAPDPALVRWTGASGASQAFEYIIPNMNQCKECHENSKVMGPLGPKARNLNREFNYSEGRANQLAYWTKIGYLKGAPEPAKAPLAAIWDDPATGSVEKRARAYLDVQCAHCHNPQGSANTSGLFLGIGVAEPLRLGLCKVPVSAGQGSGGLRFDIVPGKPEESILVYRLNSTAPKVMMPEVGRSLVDEEGVALIREWVNSLEGGCGGTS